MIEEMDALTDNGTWDLVCLPVGRNPLVAVGCSQRRLIPMDPLLG